MFYRLVAIDDRELPAPMVMTDTEYRVAHGGLLLEPPRGADRSSADGYGVLQFFGSRAGRAVEYIGSTREHYRWPAPGILDFSPAGPTPGAFFSGVLTHDRLELVGDSTLGFVREGTRLSLVAAPESPISSDWTKTFNFGAPTFQPVDAALRNDPTVMALFKEAIRSGEPDRLRAAASRLEVAWRAPA